jgi:hypothetical protein
MVTDRTPEQADVLDLVARLKASDARQKAAAQARAALPEGFETLEFPPEFYEYFTVEAA